MAMTRRELLTTIGMTAGTAAMYSAMTSLGFAQESNYNGPVNLTGAPQGARVLVLGAGLAGMTAALELRSAGYDVQILEYREKAGGRCWTLRGGDVYTEMGGAVQEVGFEEGNYFNPGPWRIPYNHYAVLDYCRRLGVELQPFIQENHNAYLHRSDAFGGEPQRYREVATDFRGHVSELLAKATNRGALDEELTEDDRALLLEALRGYGTLTEDYEYVMSEETSDYRGFERWPGGGQNAQGVPSEPLDLETLLDSRLWRWLPDAETVHHQQAIFQPVGGMDMIAQAFAREVGDLITYNAKVVTLRQDENGVTAGYVDAQDPGDVIEVSADWCVCTIPFSILGQIDHNFTGVRARAIQTMYYADGFKAGLEFRRRFWEEDEHIYGGISYTDLPITLISYPSHDYLSSGGGVLLGAYCWGAPAYQFNAMQPEDRMRWVLEYGTRIHAQYPDEFKTGVSVPWHKVPWVLGCYGIWEDKERDYEETVRMAEGERIALAGEHLSYLPAWQEGAILSALDAIQHLHDRATQR